MSGRGALTPVALRALSGSAPAKLSICFDTAGKLVHIPGGEQAREILWFPRAGPWLQGVCLISTRCPSHSLGKSCLALPNHREGPSRRTCRFPQGTVTCRALVLRRGTLPRPQTALTLVLPSMVDIARRRRWHESLISTAGGVWEVLLVVPLPKARGLAGLKVLREARMR